MIDYWGVKFFKVYVDYFLDNFHKLDLPQLGVGTTVTLLSDIVILDLPI